MQPNVVITATAADEPAALARQIAPITNEIRFALAAPGHDINAEQMARLLEALQDAVTATLTDQLAIVADESTAAAHAATQAATDDDTTPQGPSNL